MKIAAIYTRSVGPLADGEHSFKNEWTGEIESKILLTGPNGCGKSTLLRTAAMLWDALGYWLDQRKPLPPTHRVKKQYKNWQGIAVIYKDIETYPFSPVTLGLYLGTEEFVSNIMNKHQNISWFGETIPLKGKNYLTYKDLTTKSEQWLDNVAAARGQLVLGTVNSDFKPTLPNIIYLDAEARRWIAPKKNLSSLSQDDLALNWLATYEATDDWKGQLESSLFNLKATLPNLYPQIIDILNSFLFNKKIATEIQPGQRQQVLLANGRSHTLDELSSGEHQVLIMLFTLQRWLQPEGIVLIDEPDLHLHPSLIGPLLSAIENIVKKQNGQLIITSHATEIWQRYENLGMRIDLSHRKSNNDGKY